MAVCSIARAGWFIVVFVMVSHANSMDPRCADVVCTSSKPPFDPDFVPDSSVCSGETCPRCLNGPQWENRLKELREGEEPKQSSAVQPQLVFDNWLSSNLVGTIFRILAEEGLGIPVKTAPKFYDGFQILCCEETLLSLEMWPTKPRPNDEDYFTMKQLPIGYEGAAGLFIGGNTLAQFPLATAYGAYKHLPEYGNIFPRAFETPCEDMIVNASLGCVPGNYVCDDNWWTNTTCDRGRYVPPQCAGENAKYCQELLLAQPKWDSGFFEGLIRNMGLNFTCAYVGSARLPTIVRRKVFAGEHVMFYWWKPDPFVTAVGGREVNFPPSNVGCITAHNIDPTLSRGDCAYKQGALAKLARRADLTFDPDFEFFFTSFQLSAPEMDGLLRNHLDSQGTMNAYQVSCDWVENNFDVWKSWMRFSPPDAAVVASTSESSHLLILAAVVLPIVVVLIIAAVMLYVRYVRRSRQNIVAPKTAPLCLVITGIEASSTLHREYPLEMNQAVTMHDGVIRECIDDNGAYEYKRSGESFYIASTNILDATMLAIDIQRRLMTVNWPKGIAAWQGTEGSGPEYVWYGLRVRISVHLCHNVTAKLDLFNHRFDYHGPDADLASGLCRKARGGQIMMLSATYEELVLHDDYALMVGEELVAMKFAGSVHFESETDCEIFSVTPIELEDREFVPIPGAENFAEYNVNPDAARNATTVPRIRRVDSDPSRNPLILPNGVAVNVDSSSASMISLTMETDIRHVAKVLQIQMRILQKRDRSRLLRKMAHGLRVDIGGEETSHNRKVYIVAEALQERLSSQRGQVKLTSSAEHERLMTAARSVSPTSNGIPGGNASISANFDSIQLDRLAPRDASIRKASDASIRKVSPKHGP